MSNQPSDIGRALFGYRRSSVNQAISDRDMMLRQSENRAREAEARSAEMEERLTALQREIGEQQLRLADRDRHVVELREHIDRLIQQQLEAPPTTETVGEEVARLLRTAEESATRIVEQARTSTARDTAEAQRRWRELRISLERYAGWRGRVDPQLADLHARMADLRLRITEIPDRLRGAFAPLAEASAATEAGLLALSDDLTPPLLSAPSRSDASTQPPVDSGFRDGVAGSEQGDDDPGEAPHGSPR